MRPRQPDTADLGTAGVADSPITERPLRVVPSDAGAGVQGGGAQQILERVTSHIRLAKGLGVSPLTIDERATAMLDGACDGWRFDRRCRDGGMVLDVPHPLCLRAQYHHDVLLLEHGLLNHERLNS